MFKSRTSKLAPMFAALVVVGLFASGCTTGPLGEIGRQRAAEAQARAEANGMAKAESAGSLDEVANRVQTDKPVAIPPAEPEIRIPEADRALVETLEDQGLSVRYTERGVVVTLADIVFEFGSARLTSDAHRKLRALAGVMLHEARGRAIAVEGHTDSIGAELYNQGLSERRAVSVADSLTGQGVSARLVTTRGYGSAFPIAPNEHADGSDDPDGRTLNRRVEIVIAH